MHSGAKKKAETGPFPGLSPPYPQLQIMFVWTDLSGNVIPKEVHLQSKVVVVFGCYTMQYIVPISTSLHRVLAG